MGEKSESSVKEKELVLFQRIRIRLVNELKRNVFPFHFRLPFDALVSIYCGRGGGGSETSNIVFLNMFKNHYSMDSAMDNPPLLRNSSRTRAGLNAWCF